MQELVYEYDLTPKKPEVDYANWKGVRWGFYHYNETEDAGEVTILWARLEVLE